jgi:hypothetical protein
LKGLYPQTEIGSNDPEGARLEFETASEQRVLNRRDRSLIHWWSSNSGFLVPLSHRRPVLAFQLPEQRKIGSLLLFREAQLIPRKVITIDYFSLDRPLDIGKRVFRNSVAGESQRVFQESHLSGKR